MVRGKFYPSQKSAAKALGVGQSAVSQALIRDGHCDKVGLGPRRVGNTNAKKTPVKIGRLEFSSQLGAAKALGVARITVRRYADGALGRRGMEALAAAVMRYSD